MMIVFEDDAVGELDRENKRSRGGLRPVSEADTYDPRRVIRVRAGHAGAVDELEEALIEQEAVLYERGRRLVTVSGAKETPAGALRLEPGAPLIHEVGRQRLWEMAARAARHVKEAPKGPVNVHPPREHLEALLARREYRFPPLAGVIEGPTLRPDGSVLDKEGYDEATGLLLLSREGVSFPAVAQEPGPGDANRALNEIEEVFADFPFKAECDRAVATALVLTLAARHALDGPAPAFGFDAPTAGTGKTLAAKAACLIGTGRMPALLVESKSAEEDRKRLHAMAMAGVPAMLIDNVDRGLRSGALAGAITAGEVSDRLLGTPLIVTAPFNAVVIATGNNLKIERDLRRRFLVARIDARSERPDERAGFHHADLLPWVARERPRLLVAALTILRAFVVAGRPSQRLSEFGSFEAWSRLVREALVWAGAEDPKASQERLRETGADPEDGPAARTFAALHELFGERPFTLREAVAEAEGALPGSVELRESFAELLGIRVDALFGERSSTKLNPSHALGLKFRELRDRVLDGLRLEHAGELKKVATWRVSACE